MKRLLPIALLALAACAAPDERAAERALRLGAAAYRQGDHARADSLFALAPHDARAVYNRGCAAFRAGRYADAIGHFRQAAALDSSTEQQRRVRFNLAAAHLAEARDADTTLPRLARDIEGLRIEGGDIARNVAVCVMRDSLQGERARLERTLDTAYAAAVAASKAALRLDPADDDARHNLVLAQRGAEARRRARQAGGDQDKPKDQELGPRARLILQQADSLVDLYRFKPALELLQQGLKEDPSLASKKEYMQRLETVNQAAQAQ